MTVTLKLGMKSMSTVPSTRIVPRSGAASGKARIQDLRRTFVIASLRRRRGNPVFPVVAFLDCFAALAMTICVSPEMNKNTKRPKMSDTQSAHLLIAFITACFSILALAVLFKADLSNKKITFTKEEKGSFPKRVGSVL